MSIGVLILNCHSAMYEIAVLQAQESAHRQARALLCDQERRSRRSG